MNCVFKREIYFFKEYQASKDVMWVKALGIFKEHKLFSLLWFRQTPTFFVLKLVKMFDTNSNYFKSCKNWTFKNSGKGMVMERGGGNTSNVHKTRRCTSERSTITGRSISLFTLQAFNSWFINLGSIAKYLSIDQFYEKHHL